MEECRGGGNRKIKREGNVKKRKEMRRGRGGDGKNGGSEAIME